MYKETSVKKIIIRLPLELLPVLGLLTRCYVALGQALIWGLCSESAQ